MIAGYRRSRKERGQALLILAALLVLGIAWALVGALNNATRERAAERMVNARLLAEAKAALIGYVAMKAADSTEDNPGRLPCPQYWGDVGSSNEGRAGSSCSDPAIGWLPWRTIGIQKPLDASGAQIWYVVSAGWHLLPGGATLDINSNTPGQLTLDGNTVVALLIAPGAPLNIAPNANQVAAGCTARNQSQTLSLPATAPNPLDFLDCQNGTTADNTFTASVVDNATNPVFNDQVVAITTADVLPALEAAIAKRIQQQVVPSLKAAYTGTKWNASSTNTVFPFAASFLPSGPGTSTYQGAGTTQGLLPFSYLPPCSPAGDPRCTSSTYHAWGTPTLSKTSGSGSLYGSPSCSVSGSTVTCQGWYISGSLQARFDDPVSNVANALRDFNLADHIASVWTNLCNVSGGVCYWDGYQLQTSTLSRRFNANASLSFVVDAPFRWASGKDWGYYYIQAQRPAIANHALLSSTDATTGWFVRNEWYRLLYYAIAPNYAPGGTLSCDSTTPTCLQVANVLPANKQRAIVILAGRSLAGAARPNADLSDFLDSPENRDLDTAFEQLDVNRRFNDRIVVIDANP